MTLLDELQFHICTGMSFNFYEKETIFEHNLFGGFDYFQEEGLLIAFQAWSYLMFRKVCKLQLARLWFQSRDFRRSTNSGLFQNLLVSFNQVVQYDLYWINCPVQFVLCHIVYAVDTVVGILRHVTHNGSSLFVGVLLRSPRRRASNGTLGRRKELPQYQSQNQQLITT